MAPKRNLVGLSGRGSNKKSNNPSSSRPPISPLNINFVGGSTMHIDPSSNPSIDPYYVQPRNDSPIVDLGDDDDFGDNEEINETPTPQTPSSQVSTSSASVSRKQTSWIWQHFIGDKEKEKAVCGVCNESLSWKTGKENNGTGHLSRHLNNRHKIYKDDPNANHEGGVQSTLNNKTGGLFFFNKDRYKIETMKFTIGSSLAFGFADGWRFIK